MKLKNIDILERLNLLSQVSNKKLPQKISFAIIKNIKTYEKERDIYQQALQNILAKYESFILKDEQGNPIIMPTGLPQVQEDQMEEYFNEINELLSIEIEVSIYTIQETDFEYDDSRYDILTTQELFGLMDILVNSDELTEE